MAASGVSLSAFSSELVNLVERTSAFVVNVEARQCGPGSGIVIGPDLVVTADHLVERDDVLVRIGDQRLTSTVAGRDPATDVAVLRVAGLGGTEPPKADVPRVGQLVFSIARTASGGVSAGLGVVSAVGGPLRTGGGVRLRQVIRTDAAARRGTSGGAIVDAAGSVLGMTTAALLRGVPIGIPIGELVEIAAALASGAAPRRAYLGVSVQPVRFPRTGPDGIERGLLVFSVAPDGAADRAGVLVGDVIVAFNGPRVAHATDLQDGLAAVEAGARVAVTVSRGGALQDIEITMGARPSA